MGCCPTSLLLQLGHHHLHLLRRNGGVNHYCKRWRRHGEWIGIPLQKTFVLLASIRTYLLASETPLPKPPAAPTDILVRHASVTEMMSMLYWQSKGKRDDTSYHLRCQDLRTDGRSCCCSCRVPIPVVGDECFHTILDL